MKLFRAPHTNLIVGFLFVVAVIFHNCSASDPHVNFSQKSIASTTVEHGVNGDYFDGKPQPGNYTRAFPGYSCDKSPLGEQGTASVNNQNISILSDICQSKNLLLPLTDFQVNYVNYNPNYLILNTGIYKFNEPSTSDLVTLALCRFKTEKRSLDVVIVAKNDFSQGRASINFYEQNSQTWSIKSVPPFSVGIYSNVERSIYSNENFQLNILNQDTTSAPTTGSVAVTIDGVFVQESLSCWKPYAGPVPFELNQALVLSGTPNYWTGNGGNNLWSNSANWSRGAVPQGTDSVIFNGSCSTNCNSLIDVNASLADLILDSTYSGNLSSTSGTTLRVAGQYYQAGGTYLGGDGLFEITGMFRILSGTFQSTQQNLKVFTSLIVKAPGIFRHNQGTLEVAAYGAANPVIELQNFPLNNVLFDGWRPVTFVGATEVLENVSFNYLPEVYAGPINVNGNIIFTINSNFDQGYANALFRLVGDRDQLVSSDFITNTLSGLEIAKTGGTATLSNQLSIKTNFIYTSGNVDAQNLSIRFNKAVGNIAPLKFGPLVFKDAIFSMWHHNTNYTLSDTLRIRNDLTINHIVGNNYLFGGMIEVGGNLNFLSSDAGGNTAILLNGSGDQNITFQNGTLFSGTLAINKTSGNVNLSNSLAWLGDVNITSGILNLGSSSLTVNQDLRVDSLGVLNVNSAGGGSLNVLGATTNSGTINP